MKKILVILIIITMFFGCKVDEETDSPTVYHITFTAGGISYDYITEIGFEYNIDYYDWTCFFSGNNMGTLNIELPGNVNGGSYYNEEDFPDFDFFFSTETG